MAQITKYLAEKIARKLKAEISTGKKHDIARVFHENKMIAQFGIRRGSNKNLGHDHIPSQIFVNRSQALLLGQCPLSIDEWIQIIKDKGKI